MPNRLDVALVSVLLVWSVIDHLVILPRVRRRILAGAPGARMRLYAAIAAGEWLFAAAVLALWAHATRPAAALGLTLPHGVRLVLATGLVAVLGVLVARQSRGLARASRERLAALRPRFPEAITFVLPHTAAERRGFVLLSCTAGICEELLARGYLIWFVGAWTGPWIAAVLSSALFGLGHAYQGPGGMVKTGAVGLVMAAVYLVTGSLLPGIVLHALVDIGSGDVAYRVLDAVAQEPTAA